MQVEIPDPPVLLGLAAAFVVGLLALLIYNKVSQYVNLGGRGGDAGRSARLEEYERQLVEMKIRLDAMGVGGAPGGVTTTSQENETGVTSPPTRAEPIQNEAKITPKSAKTAPAVPSDVVRASHHSATEQVLRMVTKDAKTSRDIQAGLGKSREHTARLLKKLYEEGLVKRSAGSRPYTYRITEAGQSRLGVPPGGG